MPRRRQETNSEETWLYPASINIATFQGRFLVLTRKSTQFFQFLQLYSMVGRRRDRGQDLGKREDTFQRQCRVFLFHFFPFISSSFPFLPYLPISLPPFFSSSLPLSLPSSLDFLLRRCGMERNDGTLSKEHVGKVKREEDRPWV